MLERKASGTVAVISVGREAPSPACFSSFPGKEVLVTSHDPVVSVVLVTYNHERYIGQSIRSVLEQTFSDLELVVVDDGSTDQTAQVIASFNDPRLISIRQENQGPGAATNRALASCRGKYLALLSGDDLCYPDRIQKQLEAYQGGPPRLLFGPVTFIDEEGAPRNGGFLEGIFDVTPRTRAELYHRFFFQGNFINGITAFTERSVFGDAPYDPLLFQLQDYDLWIRLLKRYDICFMQEPLIHYRIRANQQNLSSPRPGNQMRCSNEHLFIMRRFFDEAPLDLFREAFARELRRPDFASAEEAAFEQAFLFLKGPHPMQWLIGIEQLYSFLTVPRTAALLNQHYQLSHLDYVDLLQQRDVTHRWPAVVSSLYVDTGSGFNAESVCQQSIPSGASQFRVTFDLRGFAAVSALRWDPLEVHYCTLELERITWQDGAGQLHTLPMNALASNGVEEGMGKYSFETPDPMIYIPLAGEIAEVTLEGRWNVKDLLFSTCAHNSRLRHEVESRNQQISRLQAELCLRDQHLAALANQARSILNLRNWLRPARKLVGKIRGLSSARRAG